MYLILNIIKLGRGESESVKQIQKEFYQSYWGQL